MTLEESINCVWWYAACERCTAKCYSPIRPIRCYRCGIMVNAVLENPPWFDRKANLNSTDKEQINDGEASGA